MFVLVFEHVKLVAFFMLIATTIALSHFGKRRQAAQA